MKFRNSKLFRCQVGAVAWLAFLMWTLPYVAFGCFCLWYFDPFKKKSSKLNPDLDSLKIAETSRKTVLITGAPLSKGMI